MDLIILFLLALQDCCENQELQDKLYYGKQKQMVDIQYRISAKPTSPPVEAHVPLEQD
jgi:hypothetical protein